MTVTPVPEVRVRSVNGRAMRSDGDYVVYWMIASRRSRANFALQHAVHWSQQLGKPLLVVEALRCGYQWASDRMHAFVLQGMADNAADFARHEVRYHAYVEPEAGAGSGMLQALAERACCFVTDDFPCFFLPRMVAAAGERLPVQLEAVDSNGLLPLRVGDRVFARAVDFRRFLQKALAAHLQEFPVGEPLRGYDLGKAVLPAEVRSRWPMVSKALLAAEPAELRKLPINHDVGQGVVVGGARQAGSALRSFLAERLAGYGEGRSHPDADSASGLSPYLHFGHLSAHQIFAAIAKGEDWSVDRMTTRASGQRGWMGMSAGAESFMDELITWRELGYNCTSQTDDYASFEALPGWAKTSLRDHESDARPYLYSLEEFDRGETHDEVWNAAQRQLRESGVMQNYLRMLWGKKVLEWSRTPAEAMATLIELNNRYALDGRNPNSYTGISWVFGRFDRAWGPEREIYGKIRYMSSANTVKKLRMKAYMARWGDGGDAAGRPAEQLLFE